VWSLWTTPDGTTPEPAAAYRQGWDDTLTQLDVLLA